jgi:hypothetical protein
MSKTTTTLFVILILFVGLLLFVLFGMKQNSIIKSFMQPSDTPIPYQDTTLTLSTNATSFSPGQTVTAAVLIHNTNPEPSLAQLEIAYDPLTITVESVSPGNFFRNPTIALQNIDPVAGRISYALRCPASQQTVSHTSCVDETSETLATITFSINRYTIQNTATISFLPKTVVRVQGGKDILAKTEGLQVAINKTFYQISSSSAIASPAANIRILPQH